MNKYINKLKLIFKGDLNSHATFEKSIQNRIAGLDELRGIAILLVLFAHGAGLMPQAPLAIQGLGTCGVLLFFFVSGYLITTILIQQKNKPSYFSNFYIRRIMRIWPLMLLALAVSAYFYPQTAKYFIYNLGLTNNYHQAFNGIVMERTDVMWSLAVEEHFYLFWPILVFITPKKYLETLCLFLVTTGFLFNKELLQLNHMIINKTTHGNMHYIALGCGLAINRSFFKKSLYLLAVLFLLWGLINDFKQPYPNMPVWVFNTLWVLGYIVTAQTIHFYFGSWSIKSTVLAVFGKLCYGLYIIHFFLTPLVWEIRNELSYFAFVLFVLLSLSLSWISYKFIEIPIQNTRFYLERNKTLGRIFLSLCAVIFIYYLFVSLTQIGTL